MRGYLQRLARAVMQPAESIHPLLGSVFSPANYGRADDSLEQNVSLRSPEVALSAPERPHEVHDLQAAHSPLLPPVQPTVPAALMARESAGLDSAERVSFQPLLAPVRNEFSSTSERKQEHDSPAESGQHEEPEPVYPPLLTRTLVRSGPPEISNLKPQAAGTGAASEKGNSSRRAEREPDEIQIQIGRIEVTAVQHAPARTVIKPNRNGQSLDEYLKRRDRRA